MAKSAQVAGRNQSATAPAPPGAAPNSCQPANEASLVSREVQPGASQPAGQHHLAERAQPLAPRQPPAGLRQRERTQELPRQPHAVGEIADPVPVDEVSSEPV